jgi:hypothetical protein
VDPAVDETGTPYAFVAGDPVNGSDPDGMLFRSTTGSTCVNARGCVYRAREEQEQHACLVKQQEIIWQNGESARIRAYWARRDAVGGAILVGGGTLTTGVGGLLAAFGYENYAAGATADYAAGEIACNLFSVFAGGLGLVTGGVIVVGGVVLISYGISDLT